MSLHLITGYAGSEHITSADQGAYNMGTFGEGEFVLDRGNKFAATVVTNNSISIADGEAMMQGRFIKQPLGTTETVSIDNGASGMKRKDLIVLRYTKNSSTGVESASFEVIKGTPDASSPVDPSYTQGDITDGTDLVNDMPLYRVNLDGLNIASMDTLFSVKVSMVDYMDDYQLPVASGSNLGGVKVWPYNRDGLKVEDSFLKIHTPANADNYGVCGMNYQAQSNKDGLYFDSYGRPRIHQAYIDGGMYYPINNAGSITIPVGVTRVDPDEMWIPKSIGLTYILHLGQSITDDEINEALQKCLITSMGFMNNGGNVLPLVAITLPKEVLFDGTYFRFEVFHVFNPTQTAQTIYHVGPNVVNLFHMNK